MRFACVYNQIKANVSQPAARNFGSEWIRMDADLAEMGHNWHVGPMVHRARASMMVRKLPQINSENIFHLRYEGASAQLHYMAVFIL